MVRWLVLVGILVLCSVAAANSDYCSPYPNDITTSVIHEGNWFNITFTSPSCYVCIDNGAGYGDVDCTHCPEGVGFVANATCGIVPFSVVFTDTSAGNITAYYWNFSNGNTSIVQTPVANFTSPGVYDIKHNVISNGNLIWNNKSGYIIARAPGDTCVVSAYGNVEYVEKVPEDVPLNPMIAIVGLIIMALGLHKKHS